MSIQNINERHYEVEVPLDGTTWVYQEVYLDLDTEGPDIYVPKTIILTNISADSVNMYVKLLRDDDEGAEVAGTGLFLKAGGQLVLNNNGTYQVGIILANSAGDVQNCMISTTNFGRMVRLPE